MSTTSPTGGGDRDRHRHARGRGAYSDRRPPRDRRGPQAGFVGRLLPLVLAAVVVLAGIAAYRSEAAASTPTSSSDGAAVTPVLSARRVPALLAAPVADRRLQSALNDFVTRVPGTECLTVRAAGRDLFTHNADQPLVPASVHKLLTASAVLAAADPGERLSTEVMATSAQVDGTIDGDLYVVGGGDPLLMTDAYERHFEFQPQTVSDMEVLADQIVAAGVQDVTGGVVGDESRYDQDRYVDVWAQRLVDQNQAGPLSAMSVNDGFVAFPPNPDVVEPDEEPAISPAAHAAGVLTDLLEARGVSVGDPPAAGDVPEGAVQLLSFPSPPLGDVVGQMLRFSDNNTAELLVKELGRLQRDTGTTEAGVAAMVELLDGAGLPTDGSVVTDGSGLSEAGRLTCTLANAVLDGAGPDSVLATGLPVAGQTGSLTERFTAPELVGRLRAKTGTLNWVTALAGYVDTAPGAELTFAFIVNLDDGDAVGQSDLALQDELARILVRYPEGPPLAQLGPVPSAAG
jgi:D-alanyl-D-alanine carboxypeptidase/D-alanyl-D-alanine-endopeptidase (penicillin-binding protein 4)